MKSLIIAIDGFSSCGKSTFAKMIAKKLNYTYLDTGAMYRALTLFALKNNLSTETIIHHLDEIKINFSVDENGAVQTLLNDEPVEKEIRSLEVSNSVSIFSAVKEVRQKLVSLQQNLGKKGSVVLDGRDIGTTVFPNADIKIFMTASVEIRAQRRFNELKQKGIDASFEEISENIKQRDFLDINRQESPLRQAPDALHLDNGNLSFDDQMHWFEGILKERFPA